MATSLDEVRAFFPGARDVPELLDALRYFRAMGELPLATSSSSLSEGYRFLWLRSWVPAMVVRVDMDGDHGTVLVKELHGLPFGPHQRPPSLKESRNLSIDEARSFRHLLKAADFWRLPVRTTRAGLDGAYWILEGRACEQHHVAVRWSPEAGGSDATFRELCEFMIALAPSPLPVPSEITDPAYDSVDVEFVQQFATNNRSLLNRSDRAGCCDCGAMFHPSEIDEWIRGTAGATTATCPRCEGGPVLPSAAPITLDKFLLDAMRARRRR